MIRQTFNRYLELARVCGPVTVYTQKTWIVIQARVRFAGAVVRRDFLDETMWLKRRAKHRRLSRVESFGKLGYGHHFRLRDPGDVDKSLGNLMMDNFGANKLTASESGATAYSFARSVRFLCLPLLVPFPLRGGASADPMYRIEHSRAGRRSSGRNMPLIWRDS